VSAESRTTASVLGIASLVVGFVGLAIGIIPCVGILGLPVAAIGLLLGLVGLVVALAGGREAVGLPSAGSGVSLLGCVVSVVWWYISLHSAVSNTREGIADLGKRLEEQKQQMERQAREQQAKEAQARANPVAVSARDLLDAYEADPAAADRKYRGRWLEVTGEVAVVNVVQSGYFTLTDQGRFLRCGFTDAAARLKQGDTVTVKGQCAGKPPGGNVQLLQCELVKK
jgi:hypothetical protein